MKFLEDLDFSKDDIAQLVEQTPDKLLSLIKNNKKLVEENITYLKNIGVKNYKDIFIKFNDIFLMDSSNFKEIFSKYELNDLIDKLAKNKNIVEFL